MKRSRPDGSVFCFGGFTLIEVMITVAVIAILAAVALPNYIDYVTRSKLVEAKTNLADMRTRLEQYFLDNRKYPANCADYASGPPPANTIYKPASIKNFQISCALADTSYVITADSGSMGFKFTIDQANTKQTTAVPSGWHTPSPNVCWVSRKSGEC
jgi:type IV pilus assembly protein PilE